MKNTKELINDNVKNLLLEITKCKELENRVSVCKEITNLQRKSNNWQIPEPWSGFLDSAPVLFICLNPSIDENQLYPLKDSTKWPDKRIVDYFTNLFAMDGRWVKDGIRPKQVQNDTYSKKWVRNWAALRSWYGIITGKKKTDIRIGEDYVITDIVHCKSLKGKGVNDAIIKKCSKLYLKRILSLAAANLIIVLGEKAREVFTETFTRGKNGLYKLIPFEINGVDKFVIFMHHTNYYGTRRPDKFLSENEFESLKTAISKILT